MLIMLLKNLKIKVYYQIIKYLNEYFYISILGYTTIKYDTHRLIQARPLSPIQDLKTIQIYVDSSTNTVHQIVMKH